MKKENKLLFLKEFFNYLNPHKIQGRIFIFNISWWVGFTIFVASCLAILLNCHKELVIIINAFK